VSPFLEAVFDDHRLRDLTETPLEVIKKAPGHLLSALKETDVYFVVGIEPKNLERFKSVPEKRGRSETSLPSI